MLFVDAGAEDVERAPRRVAQFLDDVSVDHRCLDARVSQVLLDLSDIHAVEQQVRREAMLSVCTETGLSIFALRAAALTAFWMTESLRW